MRSLALSFVCAFVVVSCSSSKIPADSPAELADGDAVSPIEREPEGAPMTFSEAEPQKVDPAAEDEAMADALGAMTSDPEVLDAMVGTGRGGGGTGEGTVGLGNMGLIGEGGGGGSGSGYGRGTPSGSGSGAPRVRQAKATVQGPLDKDIIRRIVRAHINEVRHCYNDLLAVDASAKGRVAIDFTIGANGQVEQSSVADDSMKDPSMATCIAAAVKRWKFPKPANGSSVKVLYPFTFLPG